MARSLAPLVLAFLIASAAGAQAPGSTSVLSGGDHLMGAETISISAKNADLQDVLRMIVRTAGLNLVLDTDLKGKTVTLDLDDVPWDVALDLLLKTHGLGAEWNGKILQIGSSGELVADLVQRARLRELQADSGPLVTVARTLSHANAADVERLVEQQLSDRGRVAFDRRTNTLIIEDTPAAIRALTGLLNLQDEVFSAPRAAGVGSGAAAFHGPAVQSWHSWLLESSDSLLGRLDLPGHRPRTVAGSSATLAWAQLTPEDLELAKLLLGRLSDEGGLKLLSARPFGLGPGEGESFELGLLGTEAAALRLDLALDRDGGRFVLTFRCFRGPSSRLPLAWHGPTDAAWIVELQASPGEARRVLLIAPES